MPQEKNGWVYPDGVDLPDNLYYKYKIGRNEIHDLNWYGHVHLLHQTDGFEGIETEVVADGIRNDVQYAAVKATVCIDGDSYASIGSADLTSNQVGDPEHLYSSTESRAIKRAVKKALGIIPTGPAPDDGSVPQSDPDVGRTPSDSGIDPDEDTETSEPSGPPDLGGDDDQPW